jgi:hypothetical protein
MAKAKARRVFIMKYIIGKRTEPNSRPELT